MVNSPFDIMKPHSYEDFLAISGITENETKGALRAVGAWALSVTAAAIAPGQSSMRTAYTQIGKSAQEQFENLKKAVSGNNLVERIESEKETLQKLAVLKQNLQTHNKVITQYNQRFVFKEGIAACKKHDGILREIELHEKLVQENLNQHCMQYSREIEDRLMDQILAGMPVDRDFVRDYYPGIIKKYDFMPPMNRDKALSDLHFLLNKAYIGGIKQRLNDDFRSVIPKTMEKLFAKMGLSKHFEAENAKKAVDEMSQELAKQMDREDIGTLSLPDCVDFVQGKFMAYAAALIQQKAPNEKALIGAVDLLYQLHQTELDAQPRWRAMVAGITDEQIKNMVMEVYSKDSGQTNIQGELKSRKEQDFTQNELPQIIAECKVFFRDIEPASVIKSDLDFYSMKDLIDFGSDLPSIRNLKDDEYLKSMYKGIIEDVAEHYIQKKLDWNKNNEKFRNFSFDQFSWGSDQILGDGCCWAIVIDWAKRLMELGNNPLPATYEEFNPKEKDVFGENVDSKKSTKAFLTELNEISEQSMVTRKMRLTQALAHLESPKKRYTLAAKKIGLDLVDLSYKNGDFTSILTEFLQIIRNQGLSKNPAGVYKLSGFGPVVGHAMLIQINPEKKLYRFADPNNGMYTFTDPDTFIREVGIHIHNAYPEFKRFSLASLSFAKESKK